ncbi:FadR/GntR family transcriptional regulator [Sphingomonas flavalba]|uniref:FadR/GntR family transcriptional regulator n=1 Tax=Sphingomonas flavalba TaxID=2559804 RepID=UPI0039E0F2CC
MDRINDGTYPVGGRMPAEREISAEFNVSRPTVREAIIALEVQGVVEVRVGSGAYVRRQTGRREAPGFGVTAFELTEARLLFESEAAALAATNITDEELDELPLLVARMDAAGDPAAAEEADRDFHMLIARATRNAAIAKTIEAFWEMRQSAPECALLHEKARNAQVKPVIQEHMGIVEALQARDPARARTAMREHLGAVIEHLLFATEEEAIERARQQARSTRDRFVRVVSI